jgi:hypothetical protein
LSEVHAEVTGSGHPRLDASRRRARAVRVLVYLLSALLSVWLVVSAITALINGLINDMAVDPFTQERVDSTGNDP